MCESLTSRDNVNAGDIECTAQTSSTHLEENVLKISKESENQDVCIFCGKNYKKHKGQRQPLCALEKESFKKSLIQYEKFIKDTEVYKKVQSSNSINNHRICRKDYFNKLREFQEK